MKRTVALLLSSIAEAPHTIESRRMGKVGNNLVVVGWDDGAYRASDDAAGRYEM